ncbi:uncharacterized protein HGUI_02890 [Hanseniaspora guilliermondii]|uniref:LicD/FKTN/FKRP nucleotidyltransferase domain-containing protein n=1 Tax=Hanseniaspora guilliermondii TaxID=56406 RepID=A0A1L0B2R3_9ASCO|nr:uncharacterized protein HGUI_02890 [Hanseniaspora guilliermondii]
MGKLKVLLSRKPKLIIYINIIALLSLFAYIMKVNIYNSNSIITVESHLSKIYKTDYSALLKKLDINDNIYSSFDIIDDYMTGNSQKYYDSPDLKPKKKVAYDRKKVVATKFGSQKYITALNKKTTHSSAKNLYYLLKFYLWCLANNINYPVLPINVNEWQNNDSINPSIFSFTSEKNCKCFDQDNNSDLDYREQKESIYCKKKQSEKYLQSDHSFNPEVSMFLFKNNLDINYLTVRIKNTNKPVTENLASFLNEEDSFYHSKLEKSDTMYYPIAEIINEIKIYNSINEPLPTFDDKKIKESDGYLIEEDFTWDMGIKMNKYKPVINLKSSNELDMISQKKINSVWQSYHRISISLKQMIAKKYFYEVAIKSKIEDVWRSGTHYDWRFFKGLKPLSDRNEILNDLFDAWSTFTKKDNVTSWLSHGNLLSWMWTGGQFLWDKDLDMQLPISHLSFLAENYNNTLFMYMTFKNELKMYYLDINPSYASIYHGSEGKNSIDGRFIDVQSGLYIDLTAVSYKQAELETVPSDRNALKELHNLKWVKNLELKMKPRDSLDTNTQVDSKTVLLGDKNYHFYKSLDTLIPLRKVKYGYLESETYIPHDMINILNEEYPSGLLKSEYNDYNFDLSYHGWVKKCETSSEKAVHRNCEGLSDEQFDLTKKGWYNHYSREREFCSDIQESETLYCQWFAALNKDTVNKNDDMSMFFGNLHRYISGKSKTKQIDENLKMISEIYTTNN